MFRIDDGYGSSTPHAGIAILLNTCSDLDDRNVDGKPRLSQILPKYRTRIRKRHPNASHSERESSCLQVGPVLPNDPHQTRRRSLASTKDSGYPPCVVYDRGDYPLAKRLVKDPLSMIRRPWSFFTVLYTKLSTGTSIFRSVDSRGIGEEPWARCDCTDEHMSWHGEHCDKVSSAEAESKRLHMRVIGFPFIPFVVS